MIREERYTVLKVADVTEALSPDECSQLIALEEKVAMWREQAGKAPLQTVTVEHDWPEYEPTWQAIERRVDGELPICNCNGYASPDAICPGFDRHAKRCISEKTCDFRRAPS
jgi:hypothetical protein